MSKENCNCKNNDIVERIETLESRLNITIETLENVIANLSRVDTLETMTENVIVELGRLECLVESLSHGIKV